MGSVECGVWNAECGMRSVEGGVWRAESLARCGVTCRMVAVPVRFDFHTSHGIAF